jgi:hypothetical protein
VTPVVTTVWRRSVWIVIWKSTVIVPLAGMLMFSRRDGWNPIRRASMTFTPSGARAMV